MRDRKSIHYRSEVDLESISTSDRALDRQLDRPLTLRLEKLCRLGCTWGWFGDSSVCTIVSLMRLWVRPVAAAASKKKRALQQQQAFILLGFGPDSDPCAKPSNTSGDTRKHPTQPTSIINPKPIIPVPKENVRVLVSTNARSRRATCTVNCDLDLAEYHHQDDNSERLR